MASFAAVVTGALRVKTVYLKKLCAWQCIRLLLQISSSEWPRKMMIMMEYDKSLFVCQITY